MQSTPPVVFTHDVSPSVFNTARTRAEAYLMVLLGGDAGLRLGEIVALEWRDVDLSARRLSVQRSDWLGHVTVPKGGRSRQLPMTQRPDRQSELNVETLWRRARRWRAVIDG
jgi:integrase